MSNTEGDSLTLEEGGGSVGSEIPSLVTTPRRRRALKRLLSHDDPMELSDLADEVASVERRTATEEVPAEDAKLVYLDLYHSHVPKLAEANVVEYSRETDVVEPTVDTGRVTPHAQGRRRTTFASIAPDVTGEPDVEPPTDESGQLICARPCNDGSRCLTHVPFGFMACYQHDRSRPIVRADGGRAD